MTAMAISIRPAEPADLTAVAELLTQLECPATAEELAPRLESLRALGERVLVAETDGRVRAVCTVHVMPTLHRPGPVGRISMLVVDEAARGWGVGAAMVAEAERLCLQLGCVVMEVTSNRRLVRAHRFYEQLGYALTSYRFAKPPA